MKLQEHRAKLDQHKMYLMHIAAEADIVEQQEDSVRHIHSLTPPPKIKATEARQELVDFCAMQYYYKSVAVHN